MRRLGKSALLLLDNAPSHVAPDFSLTNTEILLEKIKADEKLR